MNSKSVRDIVGPWIDSEWDSGLLMRCRKSWNVPVRELTNEVLATFLRQQIATEIILDEARARLNAGFADNSELYDGELAAAVREASERHARRT